MDILTFVKYIAIIMSIYIIFALVFAIIPYALPKAVSQEHIDSFNQREFRGKNSPDRVALVETSIDAFSTRMQLLRSAEETIDITYHTVGYGVTSDYFFGEVLRAADRGVQVRILIDAKVGGMKRADKKDLSYALSDHPNIEFKVYNKFGLFTPWRWNTLLHDKFIIIDDTYLLSGGRNIGDIYFDPPWHEGRVSNDRDVLVVNTSPNNSNSVIPQVQEYMNHLWAQDLSVPQYSSLSEKKKEEGLKKKEDVYLSLKDLELERPDFFQLPTTEDYINKTVATEKVSILNNPVSASKKEPWAAYDVARLALESKETVIIQTPYATGNTLLLDVLTEITDNEVDLQILTNSLGATPNYPAFSNYYSQRELFLDTGAEIYEYQDDVGSLHGKSYLFDNELSIVGSLNLDDRSFYIDTETLLVIDSPEFHAILRDTIQDHQNSSLIVGTDNEYVPNPDVSETKSSGFKKGLMRISSVFSRIFQFLI